MNILLVRPRPHKDTIGLQSVMICEPLELMQLSAVLKANGHSVALIDMILEKKPLSYYMAAHSPHLVCFTGYISHIGVIKKNAAEVKAINPDVTVAVGGVHAAVCPHDFESPHIDIICRSDVQLYDYLGCQVLRGILPDRDITAPYAGRYYYLFQHKCALLKTSLGCPYRCSFCFCKEIEPYKARDIDDVILELLTIPQREVYIVDDNFLFNRDRLLEFYEKVKQKGIEKNYLVYGRADFIANNEDVMIKLKEIGLSAVIVGVEAAEQETLDTYNKKTEVKDNEGAIAVLRRLSIECYATVILGIDWKKGDFDRLYRFLRKNKLIFVNLQPFTPMPGTSYFEEYRNSLLIPYEEHEKWDMAHLVVRPGGMSVRRYYLNIIGLYFKITMRPSSIAYMFKKYGVITTLKLSVGASSITAQYLKKAFWGEGGR